MFALTVGNSKQQYKNLLFLDTETETTDEGLTQEHRVRLCVFAFIRLNTEYTVVTEDWYFTKRSEVVLQKIEHLVRKHGSLTIIGSNVNFDLGALGFYEYFCKREWELKFFVEKGMVFILSVGNKNRTLRAISIQNLMPFSIKELGILIGEQKLDVSWDTKDLDLLQIYCFRDCEILIDAFIFLLRYVWNRFTVHAALTLSSLSMRIFANRYQQDVILIHDDDRARDLERQSFRGGRTECYRIGEQNGQIWTMLDVNSMYPFVMKKFSLPVKLEGFTQDMTIGDVDKLLDDFCVIADVEVETDEAVYPVSDSGHCLFPIGRFRTVLCTGSLKYALDHNHVTKIFNVSYYRRAKLFECFVDSLWLERKQYIDEGKKVENRVIKLIMNSAYGKFAEQHDVELSNVYVKDNIFEMVRTLSLATGSEGYELTAFHRKITCSGKQDAEKSFVAIASHIADFARMELWDLMVTLGRDEVIYCDTDAVIVPDIICNSRLNGRLGQDLGQVKVEQKSDSVTIYGAKDYVFGETVKMKGIRKEIQESGQTTFHQLHSMGLKSMIENRKMDAATLRHVTKTLSRSYSKGLVNPDGSISPFVFPVKVELFSQLP